MKTHTTSDGAPLGVSGRMAAYFQSSQLTPLLALVAFFLGVLAIVVTPREEEPQIDVTMATVQLPFPGASVRDVEAQVAIPAEQVLAQMVGVEHVFSVARPGVAIITVQFEVGVPREQALVRLHDTLITHRNALGPPGLVLDPIITPKGIDDVPVVSLTLWRPDPTQGADSLARIAHAMEIELKRVAGTRAVQTLGAPAHELRVELDADRLAAFDLTALEVRAALSRANGVLPAGALVRGNVSTQVEAGTHLQSAEEVRALVVGRFNGQWVHLSDVARVRTEPAPPEHMVWFGTGAAADAQGIAVRGEYAAVTLQITKKPGANAADVAQRIGQRVSELRNTLIPADVQVTITRDYGATAQDKAQQLMKKLIFATLSVVTLVFFALGRREALIVGVAVALTLATTLFASWAWGFTLNRVSLFALIFSIGILVDDAIVVVENIHRHHGLGGAGSLAALIPKAVDEVGGPTILATLTVIAALLPMAFVSGLMGPYMSPIPINASMGMGLSLVIAFTLTPWLAHKLLKTGTHTAHAGEPWLARMATAALRPLIIGAGAARKRWALGLGVLLAIALSVGLMAVQWVILKMLPFDNKSEVQLVVDMPAGTPVETTAAALQALGAYLATVPEVAHYQAYAGTAAPISFNGLVRQYDLRAAPELGDIQVNLIDKHQRQRKSHDIAQALRAPLEAIAARWNATVQVVEVPPGPPVLSPIVAEIYGPDESSRVQAAHRVRQALEATEGIVGVDDSIETPTPRWVLQVDERKAAAAGLNEQDIVHTLQTGLAASAVTTLFDRQSKYAVPIRVGLAPELAGDLSALFK
ncbi:MAG TPA: efflux RND transporter permease subunit, partial [Burkholderiaceae bacterium]|nr:efflux RND transporter permease subunit [Burkholderiaceae bacterium]